MELCTVECRVYRLATWGLARTVRRIAHCKNRGGPHTHKRHIGEQQNTNVHTQLASVVRGCLVDAHLVTCFSRPALASMECLDEGAALLNRRHLVGLQRIDLRTEGAYGVVEPPFFLA